MEETELELPVNGLSSQEQETHRSEIDYQIAQLNAKDPRTRSQAAKRLGELHAGTPALLEALQDQNPYVRSAAADALGFAASPSNTTSPELAQVTDQLLVAIDDPNDYVCASAIHSLGILRVKMAAQQIEDCLEDPNPLVIQAAILALGRLGTLDLSERLAGFLDHPHYLVRLSSARAVALLGYTAAGPSLQANLEGLLLQREGMDFKLPKAYIEALSKLKVMDAVPLLTRIAQNEVGLRSVAVEALINLRAQDAAPLLVDLFNDPSDRLRRDLIELMVCVDFRQSLPSIRPLLRDHSVSVRSAALDAVQVWRDYDSLNTIRWMVYADANPFIRPQALDCLVSFQGEAAVPDLKKLVHDVNPQVRQQAARYLEKWSAFTAEAFKPVEERTTAIPLAVGSENSAAESFSPQEVIDQIWKIKTSLACQPWPVSTDLLARLDYLFSQVITLTEEADEEARSGKI